MIGKKPENEEKQKMILNNENETSFQSTVAPIWQANFYWFFTHCEMQQNRNQKKKNQKKTMNRKDVGR